MGRPDTRIHITTNFKQMCKGIVQNFCDLGKLGAKMPKLIYLGKQVYNLHLNGW